MALQAADEQLRDEKAKQLKALSDAAAILREAGDTTNAQALEARAHMMSRAESSVSKATRIFVAARSIQRAQQERREQEVAEREDARRKELDALYRLAKEETAAKRASAGEAREETRREKLRAEEERKNNKERVVRRKENLLYMQQHLAADLVADARAFLQDGERGAARVATLVSLAKKASGSKSGLVASRAVLGTAWDSNDRLGYIPITPVLALDKGKAKLQKEWASEWMARAIYGGRDPKEAKTAEAVWSRLNKLLAEITPGYGRLFKGCHLADDLLMRYSRNVDLCVIAALQRYCIVVPEAQYPCAIRRFPWDDEQIEGWVAAHKAKARASATAPTKTKGGTGKDRPRHEAEASGAASSSGVKPRSKAEAPASATGSGSSTSAAAASAPKTSAAAASAAAGSLYSKWADAP